eukprot:156190_1
MSLSSIFLKSEWSLTFVNYFSKPSYHPKNKDAVIISTNTWEGSNKGIYEYNLQRNTFNKMHTYDQTFKSVSHGQFIDAKNELLYLFGGHDATFGVFDLNTKIMNTNTKSILSDCST